MRRRRGIGFAVALVTMGAAASPSFAQPIPAADPPSTIIFLDAGHGGADLGAKGPTLILEKNVTLRLAESMRRRLETGGRFKVVAARLDDRELSPVDRIDRANGSKASVAISLHATGGSQPADRPLTVFINKPTTPADGEADRWRHRNNRHAAVNERIARRIAAALERFYDGAKRVRVTASDRLFLGGADMPWVMVEGIDLSDPSTQLRLDEKEWLPGLATALADAVAGEVP